MKRPTSEEAAAMNAEPHWAMFSVFKTMVPLDDDVDAQAILDGIAAAGASVRGWYDVAGYRANADLMVWLTGDNPDSLQDAYQAIRNGLVAICEPVWSVMTTHMEAEFNKDHLPGFFLEPNAKKYMAVYPFVRSYDWYFMDPEERARILKDHGKQGRPYPDVIASTMATFAMSDYEWVLSFEADNPSRFAHLLRDFRNTEARLHVREDTPFYTGKLIELTEWLERQPKFPKFD